MRGKGGERQGEGELESKRDEGLGKILWKFLDGDGTRGHLKNCDA